MISSLVKLVLKISAYFFSFYLLLAIFNYYFLGAASEIIPTISMFLNYILGLFMSYETANFLYNFLLFILTYHLFRLLLGFLNLFRSPSDS